MGFEIGYWRKLKDEFLAFMSDKVYHCDTQRHYGTVIDNLTRYASAINAESYNTEIGAAFIETETRLNCYKSNTYCTRQTVIRRLNDFTNGKRFLMTPTSFDYRCPIVFENSYNQFIELLKSKGLKDSTIKAYELALIRMLQNLYNNGVDDWNKLNAKAVLSAFEKDSNKCNFATCAKRFFRYLVNEGVIKYDYSGVLPSVPFWKGVPSIYSEDEITKLLKSIDRSLPIGKRDYAILLLAVRLGLRASDIRFLSFENIDFDKKLIEIVQYKTKVPHQLSLLPEVEVALRDYIDNARPKSDERTIFLTCTNDTPRPIISISCITTRYFRLSGIDSGSRHKGLHALRMSLASGLVAEGVPYNAVRKILGHEDPETITHYVKFDIEKLRSCALEVPAASGRFAKYLIGGVGGA